MDRDPNVPITYREAIIEGLYQEMKRDRRVLLWGEDIADHGGAFGATEDLLNIFGRDRIFNTAISESAIVGAGVGAAMLVAYAAGMYKSIKEASKGCQDLPMSIPRVKMRSFMGKFMSEYTNIFFRRSGN